MWGADQGDVVPCGTPKLGGMAYECEPQPQCTQNVLSLQCASGTITGIEFASFGLPAGDCTRGFTVNPACDATQTLARVEQLCLGKARCNITANADTLSPGIDPCPNIRKHVAVMATGCVPAPAPPPPPPSAWIFDFGQNMAGFVTLHVSRTGLPPGTRIQLEHAELITGMEGGLQNTYCSPNPHLESLRHEPCAPHQTYGVGHESPDRYIGDFNDANMTNVYYVAGPSDADYTPFFAGAN